MWTWVSAERGEVATGELNQAILLHLLPYLLKSNLVNVAMPQNTTKSVK